MIWGQDGTRAAGRFCRGDGFLRHQTCGDFLKNAQLRNAVSQVRGNHRVPIHHRFIVGRRIDVTDYVFREDAAHGITDIYFVCRQWDSSLKNQRYRSI